MLNRFSNWSQFDLSGKTALITGGAGLLGPEHGSGLARCGAAIVLVDLNESNLKLARDRVLAQLPEAEVLTAVGDICDEEALVRLNQHLSSQGVKVDILVNNAALNPKMDPSDSEMSGTVENYDMRLWENEIKVGITGTFLCCKIFGSAMAERGYGVIVNIASDLAFQAPDQRVYSETDRMEDVKHFKPIGYPVVKSAMLGMNRYLATYWAHRGVRVNCLVPGAVFNHQHEHLLEQVKKRIPMGRWANRSEYQGALAFLASEASSYMTGQMIVLDGGRSVW